MTLGITQALSALRASGCDADADRIESAMTLHPEVAAVLAKMRSWEGGAMDPDHNEQLIDWADLFESALSASAEPAMVVCLPLHVDAQVMHVILPKGSRKPEWGTNLYTHEPAVQAEPQKWNVDAIYEAFKTWPEDIRRKLSVHDLRRMNGWTPKATPPASVPDEMVGKMLEGDFTKNTITFEMQSEYTLAAGTYRITPEPRT